MVFPVPWLPEGAAGRLLITAASGLALSAGCGAPPAPPAPRHLVLVTLDTVRADRLGCYGRAGAGTPHLDRLAAGGLRVERAYAQVPLTLPSHMSIFTGLFPPRHGIHVNGQTSAAAGTTTLAERLSREGFFTAAAVGGYPLAARFPVSRGFQRYDDRLVDPRNPEALERDAGRVVGAALELLKERAGRRAFLWVHFFDPHDPYNPPAPFAEAFPKDPYQGEIARVDAAVGELLSGLSAALAGEPALFVVVGDHGEGLGEHGEETHGFFVYEATLRVPLFLSGPGVPAGRVLQGPSQTVDIVPTALRLLGLPVPAGLDGLPLEFEKAGGQAPPVYAESLLPLRHYGWSPLFAAIDGARKFILAPRPELYDLQRDPEEKENLAAADPSRAATLGEWLGRVAPPAAGEGQDPAPDPRLVGLGYIVTGAKATPGVPLADPKDKLPVYQRFQRASQALEQGRPGLALPLLDELLGLEDSPGLRFQRAVAFRMAGKLEKAEPELAALARKDPAYPGIEMERGRVAVARGRIPEALEAFERHLAANPQSAEALMFRGACREMLGTIQAAESDYRRALEQNPGYAAASLRLAGLLVQGGRFEEAKSHLSRHLALHPEDPIARGLLGELP